MLAGSETCRIAFTYQLVLDTYKSLCLQPEGTADNK